VKEEWPREPRGVLSLALYAVLLLWMAWPEKRKHQEPPQSCRSGTHKTPPDECTSAPGGPVWPEACAKACHGGGPRLATQTERFEWTKKNEWKEHLPRPRMNEMPLGPIGQ
jgi:hypothetical protein